MKRESIVITAHAGAEGTLANSLDSIRSMLQTPADYIEVDVRHTVDGRAVLCHDDYFQGKKISETTFEDLNEKGICSYKVAVEMILNANKKINTDIKSLEVIDDVAEVIKVFQAQDHIILSGCHPHHAKYITEHYPRLSKILNVDELLKEASQGQWEESCIRILQICRDNKIEGINIPYYQLNHEVMEFFLRNNLLCYVWTVDDDEVLQEVLKYQIQSITTNNVYRIYERLTSK